MFQRSLHVLALTAACAVPASTHAQPSTRAQEVRWMVDGQPLVLRSERRFAGAVSSLRYRGTEYLDRSDHGRLLQGAISFDGAGECLNPTQAGASSDGRRSTSKLLIAEAGPDRYVTISRMAYWLRPGQTCTGPDGRPRLAVNRTRLSDVIYGQRLTPGWRGQAHAVHHDIQFTTAVPRTAAVVEALTVYTPPGFSRVLLYDAGSDQLIPDPDVAARPGEQGRPSVLATPDGQAAIALFSPHPEARYGRFLLSGVNKLNVVFRPEGGYPAGVHSYEAVTVIGSVDEVQGALRAFTRGSRSVPQR